VSVLFSCENDAKISQQIIKDIQTSVEIQTILRNGETRSYVIYIPSSYQEDKPTPLMINFHGFGGIASDYAQNIGEDNGLNTTANENNFIVVYPQAVIGQKGSTYWTPGDNGIENIRENDVYFTKELISEIASIFNLDQNRIYAVGFSNGGMMSYSLACLGADFIAAVGVMSGISISGDCEIPNISTSIIHFHSTEDNILPYEGNRDYQAVPDVINSWNNFNGIPNSSQIITELNGGKVTRYDYSGGNDGSSIVLYKINSSSGRKGGHVWFREDIGGINPNQLLWDFLSNYSLDD
jgi:polyhydroxybutyrate depolymerase